MIAKRREELTKGELWPTRESRFDASYHQATALCCAEVIDEERNARRIGGTPDEQKTFYEAVVQRFPDTFWLEGCAAPEVKDHLISFRLKPEYKPVARQPIPLSPYDDIRVEYHILENITQGKLVKVDIAKEGLPEWSTPVFIVDTDAKGLLGRMVCAYGPLNKELAITTFPSADPQRAYDLAAYKSFHSVVDAIWGYTQFLVDDTTSKMLTL